jgi:hypothetical protein
MKSIRTCHYLKPNGLFCGSLALRGRIYCHYHHEANIRERRRARHSRRSALRSSTFILNSNKPKDLAPLS